ncbi:hypothetical protein [Proteiniphilum acetatigenes]|uniref:hypothetical protein n=1 Tax=Proteiniphilum acetatigenes TaxID=294710 RepID=UPI0003785E86|nr:hypothetical protein [Proteiniphilum acetatigenes]
MFTKRKLKQRIISLEAHVRGLVEENQKLQVAANDARLQVESLSKAIEMYQSKLPLRNAKGQFVKKGTA